MTEKTCNSCTHFGACSKWTDFPKQCGVPVCASFAQQSEWISVEDRMPPALGKVLVYSPILGVYMTCYTAYSPSFAEPSVTHWMPLPEPPEMKGGE